MCGDLHEKIRTLIDQGRYSEAADLAEDAVESAEKTFGSDHLNVATLLNDLAVAYQYQSRSGEAGFLLERTLAIRESALGGC